MEAALCVAHCTVVRWGVADGSIWRGQIVRVLDPSEARRHQKSKPFPRPPRLERIGDVSA